MTHALVIGKFYPPHAGHHLHVLTVRDDRIVSDMVFCGGRWPAALLAEMEAAGAG